MRCFTTRCATNHHRSGRRAAHKPLLLLYALDRLKHDRQTEDQVQRDRGDREPAASQLRTLGQRRSIAVRLARFLASSTAGVYIRIVARLIGGPIRPQLRKILIEASW